MKEILIKKGKVIQKEGELGTNIYHVKSGLLRSYSIDKNGRENIFMFAPEGWFIADTCSPESKSSLFIDAIEDSIIIPNKKDIENEKKNIASFAKRMNVMQNRIVMLLSSNAIERYEDFVETYPSIVQRVPQKMIASYLGVTPETLSAAKANQFKSKKD